MKIIKIGGSILEKFLENDNLYTIIEQVDDPVAIVHGGGNYLDAHADSFNYRPRFVTSPEGIRSRYTDKSTLEIFTMAMNLINQKIVLNLNQHGIRAVTLNGILRARRKEKLIILNENNRKMVIDGGYTGRVESADPDPVKSIMQAGYIPVISPIALGSGSYLNVDADRAAAYIAGSLKADTLTFLTNVNGLYYGDKIIERADTAYIKSILKFIGTGMDKKLMASIEALEMGVRKVTISSPYHNMENGTVIYNEL
ncbi:MAG: [LysW]-aminoadipate/[LysW]-glutamate kinase [Ferroplasma sp.]|uniref:[LysW]-aminoadipate/[LysW]-glutamate kinase n=1 Tax=Ferroplasma sp. TaxID=2591003 RepID=UPI0028164938|nr:[LysW]-aminoadipate/[LysW]-glutamate kinase [Ferroplasma sp.]WMT52055.1 MAG: [LysW]-aminoadipate/[LysW]-glutamate kinase [Ferroplasma sp.]